VHHDGSRVPLDRCVPWYAANRAEAYRSLDYPVIHRRYREDWVTVSNLWLGAQAAGVARRAVEDTAEGVRGRRAIMGAAMVDMPMVPMHLGEAASLVAAAEAAVAVGCAEVDARIAAATPPTDAEYTRGLALATQAIALSRQAMDAVLVVLGGNGLREGGSFERHWRDVAAMPLHINAHPDRVYDKVGRQLLGVQPATKF
jgi:alkylation response protein AidB-like acyl-CoA dehydrogenase